MSCIKVKNIDVCLSSKKIIDSVSFDVESGTSLAIIGTSGSGKSVLLKTIIGLIEHSKGEIRINNTVRALPGIKKPNMENMMVKLGFLFQNNALFDSLTIWENIAFGLKYIKNESKQNMLNKVTELLKLVELKEDILYKYPNQISGGMSKRVALARTIALSPTIMLLDEPTTGLDSITAYKINKLISTISKKLEATTIIVTHNIQSLHLIASHVAIIDSGKISWHGTVRDFFISDNELVKQFISAARD